MKSFDAIRFLQDYNLPIYLHSRNVGRNYVGTTCPFCDDTEDHLGFHKEEYRNPTCWKCGKHTLYDTIKRLTGENPNDIISLYSSVSFIQQEEERVYAQKLTIPGTKLFRQKHKDYLAGRRFDPDYLINKYDLYVTGINEPYPSMISQRIIVPIYYNKVPVSYQGRTMIDSSPKYRTCNPEDEVVFHKDIFFNLDNVKGDSVLVVEGVFDVFRLGDNTIASFGTELREKQLLLLKRFKKVFFLFDPEDNAQKKATLALTTLSSYGILCEKLQIDGSDPGDMSDDDAIYLKKELRLL